MNYPISLLVILSFTVVGCQVGTPPAGQDILPEVAQDKIAPAWTGGHGQGPVVPGWIGTFGDQRLKDIAEKAVEVNPDLRAAAARVEAAQAAVRVASSALYPQIGMKLIGERQGKELDGDIDLGITPPDLGGVGIDLGGAGGDPSSIEISSRRWVYGLGLGAVWEADVWGRIRSKSAAAQSDAIAAEADFQFALQSIAATAARAYFSVIEAGQQAGNAQESLDLYAEYLKLTETQREQGFASDYEVAQVKSRLNSAQDMLYAANAARAQAVRALEVLLGRFPSNQLRTNTEFPAPPRTVPAGLPAELLERRPDLIAAERRFAAAFYRVNEARTARLPRFVISGSGGIGTSELDGVGTLDGLLWTFGSGVTQPIFLGGALKANQDIREAEQRAAVADYASVALRAFQEVEDALSNDHYLRLREGALTEMVKNSAEVVKLGRVKFDQGQADMFTVLRLVGENLAARAELTKVRASRLRERANLHLALGGDFRARAK
jgi:NodT family efflux transporter outer membrane factor (OMF) lipoprotein